MNEKETDRVEPERGDSHLQESRDAMVEALHQLNLIRLPSSSRSSPQVVDVVKTVLEHLPVDVSAKDVTDASRLFALGRTVWSDTLLQQPADLLYREDRKLYQQYPKTGYEIVTKLPGLGGVAELVLHHQERWNGSGFPNRVKGEEIPVGARIIKLSVDFIEYQRGMILKRQVGRQDVFKLINKFSGRFYDPGLVGPFIDICKEYSPDLGIADKDVQVLDTKRVEPGMKLARDLFSSSGILLLNEGKVFDRGLIEKLKRFESMEPDPYTLLVRPASEESDEA
ncbi:HD domain-containing protein [Halomonas ventosae]|uniref:HD domain-containing protein n=1 Tax=Halomonas ventosae TaxID=229007 RepID=A0A4R6ZV40_9GAMM|nr:HD domain-containing phosphohydrolase [Halomonas ventosae]TDR56089.1 HD domain-containing protein [Halomonas ventosae]